MGNEALKMFLENKKTAIKIGDRGLLEVSLLNIGQTFFENNNYDSALTYFKKSIDLCNELKKEKYVKHKFWAFLFQGHIYRNQSKMELAIDKYNNCIKLAMSLNDLDGLSSAYSSVGYLFFLKDNYQKALLNYLNAEKYQNIRQIQKIFICLYLSVDFLCFDPRNLRTLGSLALRSPLAATGWLSRNHWEV